MQSDSISSIQFSKGSEGRHVNGGCLKKMFNIDGVVEATCPECCLMG